MEDESGRVHCHRSPADKGSKSLRIPRHVPVAYIARGSILRKQQWEAERSFDDARWESKIRSNGHCDDVAPWLIGLFHEEAAHKTFFIVELSIL